MPITYVNAGTGSTGAAATSITTTVPAGVVNGDFLLWVLSENIAGTPIVHPPTPAGWQVWESGASIGSGPSESHIIFYRWAQNEPANYVVSGLTSGRYSAVMNAWRGVDSVTPLDVPDTNASSTSAETANPAITPATLGAWIVAVESDSAATGVTTTTYSTSNMTLAGQVSSTSAGTINTAVGTAYLTNWASGAFTPNLVPTGTIARSLATTLVLRPMMGPAIKPKFFAPRRAPSRFRFVRPPTPIPIVIVVVGTAPETDTAMPVAKAKARVIGTVTETDTAMPIRVAPRIPFIETWTGTDASPWPYPWTTAAVTGTAISEIRSNKGFVGASDGVSFDSKAMQADYSALVLANADAVVDINQSGGDNTATVGLRCALNADLSAGGTGYSVVVSSFDAGGGLRDWGWSLNKPGTVISSSPSFLTGTSATMLKLRFQTKGTTVRLKLWDPAGAEPGPWTFSTTDATISAAGYLQLGGQGGGTAPFGTSYDNLTLSIPPAVIDQPVGTVSETDSARPIGKAKAKAIGFPTETDTSMPIGRRKAKAIGIVTETDTSMPIAHGIARAVGVVTETDTARPVGKAKAKAIGTASETDTAMPVTRRKTKVVGFAVETDTSMSLGKVHIRQVVTVSETDTSMPVGKAKFKTVGFPAETDQAMAITALRILLVGTAVETDFAMPMVAVKGQADFVGIIPI